MSWKDEYYITNDKFRDIGLRLIVAGNAENGIIRWIDNYGFYEGGDLNIYRLDPRLLLATLVGSLSDQARQILVQRVTANLRLLEASNNAIFHETEIMELRAQLLAVSSFDS
eukprot:TRINITY_DN1943_c0_g1_i2.p1 TRINITY_DN1943_c0_g1~~TRINITY_DN1943_c0_g1_i2.p1  ORF type:complete len:112 (-),score=21.07 TRINITY_DN1943_c0_g1_i2:246-581(-)